MCAAINILSELLGTHAVHEDLFQDMEKQLQERGKTLVQNCSGLVAGLVADGKEPDGAFAEDAEDTMTSEIGMADRQKQLRSASD